VTRAARSYDAAGRLVAEDVFGEDGTQRAHLRRTLDAEGRLLEEERWQDRASDVRRLVRRLDACGRVVEERSVSGEGAWAAVEVRAWEYGPDGKAAREASRRTRGGALVQERWERWTRDGAGRVVEREEHSVEGERTWHLRETQAYDAHGRLVRAERDSTAPGSPRRLEVEVHTYDAAGRLVRSVKEVDGARRAVTERTWTGDGRPALVLWPGSADSYWLRERTLYDARGRPTEWEYAESLGGGEWWSPLRRRTWTWAEDGGRTEEGCEDRSDDCWSRTYDAAGREVAWRTTHFSYDTFASGSATYGPTGLLLREQAGWGGMWGSTERVTTHAYDAAGRRTETVSRTEGRDAVTETRTRLDARERPVHEERWDVGGEAPVLTLERTLTWGCLPPGR
jgi:hypothetical protein